MNQAASIIIDQNDSQYIDLTRFAPHPVSVAPLQYGDALIATSDGEMLAIERKTPEDLLGSIADGRVFNQITGMLESTRWTYLVIAGLLESRGGHIICDRGATGWTHAAVWGALADIQEMGARVVFAEGMNDYEACLLRIARRDRSAVTAVAPVKPPHPLTPWEQVICSIRGFGPKTAEALLTEYPSPAWAFGGILNGEARRKKLIDVGQERAARYYLGVNEGFTLWPVPIETEDQK